MSIDDKNKSKFEILNSYPFEDEEYLYRSPKSQSLFDELMKKPKAKAKPIKPRSTIKAPGRVLPTKQSVEKSINEIQEAYSPKPQPRTVVSMGLRRKQLSNQIRNNQNIKQDVLREYYEITEAIDKEMSNQIDKLEGTKPK
tara:strand:+ start:258 stop:680 length:423 start_codon:yes stop_codon:yes gene_type:complete